MSETSVSRFYFPKLSLVVNPVSFFILARVSSRMPLSSLYVFRSLSTAPASFLFEERRRAFRGPLPTRLCFLDSFKVLHENWAQTAFSPGIATVASLFSVPPPPFARRSAACQKLSAF